MRNPDAESVSKDPVAGGLGRQGTVRSLGGIPFWHVIPVVGITILAVAVTRNPCWMVIVFGLLAISRAFASSDHNKARVDRLEFQSGVKFSDKRTWGGHSVDPLGEF